MNKQNNTNFQETKKTKYEPTFILEEGPYFVFVKVLGNNGKVITELYEQFYAEEGKKLYDCDLNEIQEYLINKSNIPEKKIYLTLTTVTQDCRILN